jgi:hypothetical protein
MVGRKELYSWTDYKLRLNGSSWLVSDYLRHLIYSVHLFKDPRYLKLQRSHVHHKYHKI